MRRIFKWLFGSVIVLSLVALIGVAVLYVILLKSVPETSGSFQIAGLQGGVEVVLDREAVPHIDATSHEDAARAMGYVHARDRLWQMEVLRMAGQGRLSEMFGETTLRKINDQVCFNLFGLTAIQQLYSIISSFQI